MELYRRSSYTTKRTINGYRAKAIKLYSISKRFGKNFESNGMIMCASNKINDKEVIELLRPNDNSNPGDKVYLEGSELDKSKVEQITGGYYKKAIDLFKTDDNCNCMYNGVKIITESGNIVVESLKNSQIS